MNTKASTPERTQTDEGLAVERAEADHALGQKKDAIERQADLVVERARDVADEVLTTARAKADEKLSDATAPTPAADRERAREDEQLEAERAKADALLKRQRAASLARHLPFERDKTDLYLLTERARSDEALASRDDFLGMVSHDLRDLLNVILMSASLIATRAADDAANEETLVGAQRIERSAGRMARLIGDLVDIASIDAGKLAIVPTVTDATGLVLEALETWGPPALAKGVVLESLDHGKVMTKLDRDRVLQVLGNLITNAVKFSPRGAKVVVDVRVVEGESRFSVKDTGIGIPADKLDAVFERFWQVGPKDRRGLGLGLYISKCLVDTQGGKIWAESQLGVGSTFFFTVPGAAASA